MALYKASVAQLRAIYGMAHKTGLDDGDLHALVHGLTGCESLAELTGYNAGRVIDRLKELLGQETGQKMRGSAGPARATGGQQRKILAQVRAMGWAEEPERLRGWLRKRYQVENVRFLTPQQAGMCIDALKSMQAGGRMERKDVEREVRDG